MSRGSISNRRVIAVVIPSDGIVSAFIDSGALDSLIEQLHVVFIVSPGVTKAVLGDKKTVALSKKYNFFNKYLGHHIWYISLFEYHKSRKISVNQSFKICQQDRFWRTIYHILSCPLFASIVKWCDENIFFSHDSVVNSCLREIKPDILIFPGSAMDAYSHIVSRTAIKNNIPTAMVISHWDFFSKKSIMRFDPTKIYVWGEDMKNMALLDKTLSEKLLEIVGSPTLDRYRLGACNDRPRALSSFGVPLSAKAILFAGTSVPYDELDVLQRLNLYIENNAINDIYIIYRPHPRAWPRKTKAIIDPKNMRFVRVDQPEYGNSASEDHYLSLLSAIDGIVSPYSTMILEGALCGKKILCIGFSDSVNEFDFSITNTTEHLQSLKSKSWVTICERSENLEREFARLIDELRAPNNLQEINRGIQQIVYYDERPYSDRLLSRLNADFPQLT